MVRKLLPFLLLFTLACQLFSPVPTTTAVITPSAVPATSAVPSLPPSSTPLPTSSPSPSPASTPTSQSPTSYTGTGQEALFSVRFHPDGPLYAGDQVSVEVIASPKANLDEADAKVQLKTGDGKSLGEAEFQPFGIGGRSQATFQWVWDTSALDPGEHDLTFSVLPTGPTWTESVALLPAAERPYSNSHWAHAETDCCIIYYITGTDAERDITKIEAMAQDAADSVTQEFGTNLTDPVPIVMLSRVLGQGGFTTDEIAISYLDRNYAGNNPQIVLHHEMVHLVDSRLEGDLRPTLFVEGLAVYLTGGHFKPEPLMPRAAALLAPQPGCTPVREFALQADKPVCSLGKYLPLAPLIDNFYSSQHEIGYLEAGSLVQYMIDTWGWDAFSSFYRDIHPIEHGRQSQAVDAALQKHFNISLDELEKRFLLALKQEALVPKNVWDVELTVSLFDTVRRYQQVLDPSAYFMTAWLPSAKEMRDRGIVADYLRRPDKAENQALELLLVAAHKALAEGDYAYTQRLVNAVNAALDVFSGQPGSLTATYR